MAQQQLDRVERHFHPNYYSPIKQVAILDGKEFTAAAAALHYLIGVGFTVREAFEYRHSLPLVEVGRMPCH